MLRVIQNRSAAAAKNYYSHSDYLTEGQELTGHWGGKAAKLLGLTFRTLQYRLEKFGIKRDDAAEEKEPTEE